MHLKNPTHRSSLVSVTGLFSCCTVMSKEDALLFAQWWHSALCGKCREEQPLPCSSFTLVITSIMIDFLSLLDGHLFSCRLFSVNCQYTISLIGLILLLMRPRSRVWFHWVSLVHSHSCPQWDILHMCLP